MLYLRFSVLSAVFDQFEELHLIDHVREVTPYFEEKLDALTQKYDFLKERRGMGFMPGIEV